jgi:long-chain acyl-CoA synthetase
MYPGRYAELHPDRPAFIMASTGEAVTYRDYEARANQLAHLLRRHGLARLDHYAIYMENNNRYLETCGAGERSGLYYTCVNSYLTAEELAYIVDNSDSKVLVTSATKLPVARDALAMCPKVTLMLVVDLPAAEDDPRIVDYATAIAEMPTEPIPDESLGTAMLYSSGTAGRPKGITRPLPEQPPGEPLPMHSFVNGLWQYREDMIYLSPTPLYHAAPYVANSLTLRMGGTAIIMERFDPVEYLRLIESIA